MPLPTPRKGESKNNFISRYVRAAKAEKRTQDQAVAMALSTWNKAKEKKA